MNSSSLFLAAEDSSSSAVFNALYGFFSSPFFIFVAGLVLLGLFFWYLASDQDKVKRNIGTFFILGISTFSIASLLTNSIRYGIDIKGGTSFTLRVVPNIIDGMEQPIDMDKACTAIQERLDASGTNEVSVMAQGKDKILIQVPVTEDAEVDALRDNVTRIAKLELLKVHPNSDVILSDVDPETRRPRAVPTGFRVMKHVFEDDQGKKHESDLVIERRSNAQSQEVYITGKDIASANPDYQNKGHVNVSLSTSGAYKMKKLTSSMQLGRDRLAVVLDDKVVSAPVVQNTLYKEFSISGLDGKGEAENLSKILSNPLTNKLEVLGEQKVSASLGLSALEQGEMSGIIGLLFVFAFVYVYYRFAGIVAMMGLAINAIVLLGIMSLFGFVLTLPGIAGIVLTLGIAVDANVLIYERMREEREQGRSFGTALRNSFEKAFSAIFDSNITSLLTALILFWLASGSIKGFAVTTSVGVLTSMIGALIVTRVLFYWADRFGVMKDAKFLNLFKNLKTVDFMGKARIVTVSTISVLVLCAGYAAYKGEGCLGIDFTGGSSLSYNIPLGKEDLLKYQDVDAAVSQLRGSLSKAATVQEFTNPAKSNTIQIRCANEQDAKLVEDYLKKNVSGVKAFYAETDAPKDADSLEPPSRETVSALLGETFFNTAIWALAAGMFGIMMYLALRYEWSFAIGALVSTLHDIVAVILLVIVFGMELNIIHISAFLTIAGYSINDTIIIYDRIRERLRVAPEDEPIKDIMNEAINSTLSRTLLTSLCTLAVIACLFFFGGPAMRDFSATMMIGVIVGTYSSIFIASPVVLACSKKHNLRKEVQAAHVATVPSSSADE